MMPVSAIIVDDEPHARTALRHLLGAHPEVEILADCENGKAAVKAVHELKPMLMFLDIHMPKLDGFEVLELLGDEAPLVIFVTAHDDYAIQAFENNAVDYLLKPVNPNRLADSLSRVATRKKGDTTPVALLDKLRPKEGPLTRILVRDKCDVHVIASSDIIAIEAADDYVVIHTAHGSHVKQDRLTRLEECLDPHQFCRIHRSTLINIDYLANIETEGKDNRFANLKNGKNFSISRSGYSKLLERL